MTEEEEQCLMSVLRSITAFNDVFSVERIVALTKRPSVISPTETQLIVGLGRIYRARKLLNEAGSLLLSAIGASDNENKA